MSIEVGRRADAREDEALVEVLARCFQAPADAFRTNFGRLDPDDVLVVRDGGAVVGGATLIRMGQWFGGRPVPMTGVAAVGIDPAARGRGAARALMEAIVRELAGQGVALSTLYPATVSLYRLAGYELSGSRHRIVLPLAGLSERFRELPLRRGGPADFPAMEEARRRYGARHPGLLERGRYCWERARLPRGETARHDLVEEDGRLTGYVSTVQESNAGYTYDLVLTDLVALTPLAARRLLAFLAGHRSLAERARWHGSDRDPLLAMLAEPFAARCELQLHWMTRVCDLRAALAARGYPAGLSAEVHLEVADEQVPANAGRFVLEVAGGEGRVREGGGGALRLSIRGLAALYTGFRSPQALVDLGLAHADEETCRRAAPVFAGPSPFMADMF